MPRYAIRTEDLTFDYGALRAVDGLSIDVPAGSVFGFLGPNGAGKTSTIRLLLGLLLPTRGRAEVLGCDTRTQAASIRERSGALFEHPGIYERLSAEDNLDYYARIARLGPSDRRARIRELLERFGLWERRRETAVKWSRGMKQKLAVARVLLHRPELVFLDEPTAGLDPVAAAALRDDLAALAAREGATIFLTTHNMAEAERLCERVGVIRHGRLIAIGHPDELRARRSGARVEVVARGVDDALLARLRARPEVGEAVLLNGRLVLDLRGEAGVAPLVEMLVLAGVQIEEVRKGMPSLEEVFLSLVEDA